MDRRQDGWVYKWVEAVQQEGRLEGVPWVWTGRQPRDGKLSNSFHRLPEDWSFTRARWAGATGAVWRSSTKPRRRDKAGPYHHSAHSLSPPINTSRPILIDLSLDFVHWHIIARPRCSCLSLVRCYFLDFSCDKWTILLKILFLIPIYEGLFHNLHSLRT